MSIEYPVYIDVKYVNGAPSGEQLRLDFIKTSEGVPQTIPVSKTIPPGVMRDITAAAPFHIRSGDTVAVEIETSATTELDIYDFSLKME